MPYPEHKLNQSDVLLSVSSRRRGHLNEIAECKIKEKKTKNEVAYNDKLDSRTSCCLAGGYLTSYRATMALS